VVCTKTALRLGERLSLLLKGDDVFICDSCELKDASRLDKRSPHRNTHPLVRYQHGVVEEAKTVDGKLIALQTEFRMEANVEKLEKQFTDHQQALTARLTVMEDLLRHLTTR
jgi:hypothetical protein